MWWMTLALAMGGPPTVAEGSVFAPSIRVGKGVQRTAGTAFAVVHEGKTVYLSALQLVGPAGGLPEQLAADALGTMVELELVDWRSGAVVDRTNRSRALEGPALDPELVVLSGDLMAFDPGGSRAAGWVAPKPMAIGARCPAVGEVLALAGPKSLREGKVLECSPWGMRIEVAPDFDPTGASGAPWLDASGAVVGLQVAVGRVGETEFAAAIPGSTLEARLNGVPVATPDCPDPTSCPGGKVP